jgi:hypothetical protein
MTLIEKCESQVPTEIANSQDFERCSETGDTLIEVLATLVIASLCVVAFLTAFSTSIAASAEHRTIVSLDTVVRTVSERAISQIQQQANPMFVTCATPASYSGVNLGAPNGYSASITSVRYWNGSSFGSSCSAGSAAPQLISITVTGPLGTSSSISFAVDDPKYSASAVAASQIVFTTEPSGGTNGTPLTTQPVITVEDSNGSPIPTDTSTVSLVITPGSGTSGASLGGCSQLESQGVISFSGCAIDESGSGYTLTATDGPLSTVSAPFTVG